MTHTTGAPPVDLASVVPGIEAYARWTVRLHPRRGTPGPRDSHIGGPLLWPADEPWPHCGVPPDCYLDSDDPMITVAQLRADEFPEIAFPDGTDLLQILWCGSYHNLEYDGAEPVRLFWRRAADVGPALAETPVLDPDPDRIVLRPCVIDPERVVEYPWYEELPPELLERLRAWDPQSYEEWFPPLYTELATALGFKVGGGMSWGTTDMLDDLTCVDCDAPLTMLLQLHTYEWNPSPEMPDGTVTRWWPIEERGLSPHTAEYEHACEPAGIWVGRGAHGGVFVCSAAPEHQPRFHGQ